MPILTQYFKKLFLLGTLLIFTIFLGACTSHQQNNTANSSAPNAISIGVWTNEALVTLSSNNYANYQQNLQNAAPYFTPAAWNNYYKALVNSHQLDTMVQKKMVISAVATATPVILKEGVVNKNHFWQVQMPLLITSQNAKQTHKQNVVATAVVTQVPQGVGVRGLAIEQLVISPQQKNHLN